MTITDENLRWAYDALRLLENYLKSGKPELSEWASDRAKTIKIAIRKYNAKQKSAREIRYFDCEEAGYYRVFAETDYKSVEEAEKNHVPLTCYPDQLGRWFEISHKFFQKSNGKICGYAWMGMNW